MHVREHRTNALASECWLILRRSLDDADLVVYLLNALDELTPELLAQMQARHGACQIGLLCQHIEGGFILLPSPRLFCIWGLLPDYVAGLSAWRRR
jgi:hypothetical protein